MKSAQFRREREMSWRELETTLDRIEKDGYGKLTHEQLARLPTLYRSAISSLSVARGISLDRNLLDYLTNLAGRAYVLTYSSHRRPIEALSDFFRRRFPQTVRRYWRFLALSILTLSLGVITGAGLTLVDLERYYSLVPEDSAGGRTPASPPDALLEPLYPTEHISLDGLQFFASFLFTHNAKIGLLCFALGFAAGVPVIFLLFYNGLGIGAMAALYHIRGLGPDFTAWILPHGITELLAVCLCGMAGLVIGNAIVFPGDRSRLDNIAAHGRRIALVLAGAVVLFFLAALVEGFFRQIVHSMEARWSVAMLSLAVWIAYFGFAGRRSGGDR